MSDPTRALEHAGASTTAVHGGERPDPETRASSPNLVMSSTFATMKPVGFSAHEIDDSTPFTYTRWANPTVRMLEQKIALLEGAEACACYASGMAAASAIFLSLLKSGDHVIVSDICYAGVSELANDNLPSLGIEVSRVNLADPAAFEAALRPNTKLVHMETPVNPLTRVTDIAAVSRIAREAGALVSIDSTFATPIGNPAPRAGRRSRDAFGHKVHVRARRRHGRGRRGLHRTGAAPRRMRDRPYRRATSAPFNAWLIARGMATLPIRMRAPPGKRPGGGEIPGIPSHRQAG